jgi:uridine phosphorylase
VPFPQHPTKHREKALFTARELHRYESRRTGSRRPRPPGTVVLVFGRRWNRYLGRKFHGAYDARSGMYRAGAGVGVVVIPGPGAPFAAIVVEELAALGVRDFVIVGMAGSLQPELRVGSLVLCRQALRDEGTSHHYAPPAEFAEPSPQLTRQIRGALARSGRPYTEGTTWTTDAPYRETVAEVRRYRRRGILTVEMEAAAVFCVARRLRRRAAALFVISDHLDESGWEPGFHESRTGLRRALDLAASACSPDARAPGARR